MANAKYEITDIQHPHKPHLRRIRALVTIGFLVNPGSLGGYVEAEKNLDVYGNAWVFGNAEVSGDAEVYGNARVFGNAAIIWVSCIGSCDRTLTAFCTKDGIHFVAGCFYGSADEFRAKVKETHGVGQFAQEYLLAADLFCLRLKAAQESLPADKPRPEEPEAA